MGTSPAYESEIRTKAEQINISDGVNRDEAIVLAQHQLLQDNRARGLSLSSADVFGENDPFWDKDTWHVSFKTKFPSRLKDGTKWWVLNVNKETGEVTYGGGGPS